MNINDLSKIIYNHRKFAGLSRIALAEMAGVGKTVIYVLENGKETIQLDTLKKILNVLNIQINLTSPLMDKMNLEDAKS